MNQVITLNNCHLNIVKLLPDKCPICDHWIGTSGFRKTLVSSTVMQCDLMYFTFKYVKTANKDFGGGESGKNLKGWGEAALHTKTLTASTVILNAVIYINNDSNIVL